MSFGVLTIVLYMEHFLSIKSCEWCIYQRYPYVVLIVLNLIWWVKPISITVQNVINTFILTINAVLPFIHVLIEKGYIHVKCGTFKLGHEKAVLKLMDTLSAHRSCVKVNWMLWGWSMAQWHFVFASCLLTVYVWGVINVQKRAS